MPDQIGRIMVPTVTPAGEWPFVTEYDFGVEQDYRVVVHPMENGAANLKIEQRILLGTGARRFTWRRSDLTMSEIATLKSFDDSHRGSHIPFIYQAPNDDRATFTAVTVTRTNEPLQIAANGPATFEAEATFVEWITTGATYTVNSTSTRFPAPALATALLAQHQELIPLVHIRVKEAAVPDNIYVSTRRCTVGGQLYQPRLLTWSEITQAINGQSDVARFVLGNADRVLRDLAADTMLRFADIEFSLFHVGSGARLDIWKGSVLQCRGHERDEFTIEASDSIDLSVMYPLRQISRSCWKVFADGVNCAPPVTTGVCDKTFDGPNGCTSKNNVRQFGGHLVRSEMVRIKDNSTGFLGYGRRLITPSSLVADTAFGEALPEHYTDVPTVVNARVLSGRDESGYFIGLGVIGEGPIAGVSGNALDHKLDGQTPHGPGLLGFRASNGPDPAEGNTIIPADNDHYFQLDESSWPPASPIFAAGTAFATIRRRDEEGIQLRPVSEHQMQVTLSGGIGGWYWSNSTTRAAAMPNVVPPWVMVNMFLRAKAKHKADAATQAALFDVDAALAAGVVCGTTVQTLVGSGTETQFRFVGTVGDQRPLRDWLQDVCNSFLGYFTFVFGRLRIGQRINSSTVEAFTTGNVIRGSLALEEVEPEFNTLTVEIADEEFAGARNTVTVELEEHVKLYGRRSRQMILPGVSNKSQALRIAAIRTREECGGINATEWARRRNISFSTTVLGIGVEPGMVCSLTHPDMPGGAGEFRVIRWTLRPDMSLQIEGATTTDSMYDLAVGPKPADVTADPLPVERTEEVLPLQPWFPHQEQPDPSDPVFSETDWSFGVQQIYEDGADATALARIRITGEQPITETLAADPPRVGSYAIAAGGTVPAGAYVTVVLISIAADGQKTRGSTPVGVQMGGSAGKIVLSGITWPAETAGGSWAIYAAIDRTRMSLQGTGSGQPASIELTSLPNVRDHGLPQENLTGLVAGATICQHAGSIGLAVTAVSSTTIVVEEAGWATDFWAGRTAMILADKSDGSAPFWNFAISGNTDDTLTVTPNPAAAGVEAGDILTIALQASTATPTTIGDAKFQNPQYPDGLTVDSEIGFVIRTIAGTGAGQERLVESNTATVYTVAKAWDVIPDASTVFIVLAAAHSYRSDAYRLDVATAGGAVEIQMSVDNLDGTTLFVDVSTMDRFGRRSERVSDPWRLIYMFGDEGSTGSVQALYQ